MPGYNSGGEDTVIQNIAHTVLHGISSESTVLHASAAREHGLETAGESDASGNDANFGGEVRVGDVINNRFVIESLLGCGGMGAVYRAVDRRKQEADDRQPHVAIKILSEDFKHHPKAFVALQREASKSQTLAHPNIVTVFDFDRDGDIVFMTMEELSGTTLRDLIQSNPKGLTSDQATAIIMQTARGLAYAHSKGFVHADLKPANVFLTQANTVKILDFGLARAVFQVDSAFFDDADFDAGELGGLTPAYASSEMFGKHDPHPSDDVYALGLIAYELYTGRHAFDREPAHRAKERYKTPERIKAIRKRQWLAVKQSLAFTRGNRIEDAGQFLKRFSPRRGGRVVAAALLAASFIAVTTFLLQPEQNSAAPEIAFDKLTSDRQKQVAGAIANGEEALAYADFNGALFYFNSAYELHPRNEQAVAGLQKVIAHVLAEMEEDNSEQDNIEKLMQLNALMEYPALKENVDLLEAKRMLQ